MTIRMSLDMGLGIIVSHPTSMCAACMHVICHDRKCHMMCNFDDLRDRMIHAPVSWTNLRHFWRGLYRLRGWRVSASRERLEEILPVSFVLDPGHGRGIMHVLLSSLPIPPSPHAPDILQLDLHAGHRNRGRLQRPFTRRMNGKLRRGQIEITQTAPSWSVRKIRPCAFRYAVTTSRAGCR